MPVTEKPTEPVAAMYAWMIPHLQRVGRNYGYAIAVHGSMARDLDLVAIPWIESAAPEETLLTAICDAVGGMIRDDPPTKENKYDYTCVRWQDKPHGRKAACIYFAGQRFYIDLSVLPRIVHPREPEA